MTKEEYREVIGQVLYLAGCAVHGRTPDAARVKAMDLTLLYKAAKAHLLASATATALEAAGIHDSAFTQARGKAIRKVALMDAQMELLFRKFEAAGIWYMPLKGCVIKADYPVFGMREMSDHDILFDGGRADEVKSILEGMGFTCDSFGKGIHDVYFKEPVINFEMHRALFTGFSDEKPAAYYQDVKKRLIPDREGGFGFHFSPEDFYIYMLAHEYKHYSGGGSGLRSLLDIHVYLDKHGAGLDMDYIGRETEKLGISDFEKESRMLARDLFEGRELTAGEQEMLDYMMTSGTYGTVQHRIDNELKKYGSGIGAKLRYSFHRLFLPMDKVQTFFPTAYKYKILLPFLPFYRLVRGLFSPKGQTKAELKTLFKARKD